MTPIGRGEPTVRGRESPRAFLLRRYEEVLREASREDYRVEPWWTRLALMRSLAAWDWTDDAFSAGLRTTAAGTVLPAACLDAPVAAAWAEQLLREWGAA